MAISEGYFAYYSVGTLSLFDLHINWQVFSVMHQVIVTASRNCMKSFTYGDHRKAVKNYSIK